MKPMITEAALVRAAENGRLLGRLEAYVKSCRPTEAESKKAVGAFPNLAGFCRFLRCGMSAMEALRVACPTVHDYVCTVLEDEALRFSLSPTVMSAYLKQRLGLGEKPTESGARSTDCGQLRLVFEHDIMEDGA